MVDKNPWESNENSKIQDSLKDVFKIFNNIIDKNSNKDFHFFVIALLILLGIWLASGFYKIEPDEKGVVLRLGKWVGTKSSGLNYHLPYPIEEVIIQKVTVINRIDIGNKPNSGDDSVEENLMLTGDSNLANVNFTVLWKIADGGVEEFLFTARSPELIVKAVAESVIRSIIGQNTIVYAQTNGRAAISRQVKEKLQELMDEYNTGVEIVDINVQNVEPPFLVIDSFRDVERAQADQQRLINEADAYSRNILANARGKASEIINKAEGEKSKLIAEADGTTSRFLSVYEQYKLSPNIIGKRIYFDTMEELFNNIEIVIIDRNINLLPHLNVKEKSII